MTMLGFIMPSTSELCDFFGFWRRGSNFELARALSAEIKTRDQMIFS